MKILKLKGGYEAILDDEDFDELHLWAWQALLNKSGGVYVYRLEWDGSKNVTKYLRREILKANANETIDHRDGNTLDYRRSNLRFVTKTQNSTNRRKVFYKRFKGTTFDRRINKWIAQVKYLGIRKYLGSFQSEEDAARAYDHGARQYFGEFATLNFPKPGEQSALR